MIKYIVDYKLYDGDRLRTMEFDDVVKFDDYMRECMELMYECETSILVDDL